MRTLVVATPSRGLVHSRTVEAVHQAVSAAPVRWLGWVLTHDLPIPQSHERVCEKALAVGADLIWLVEEDVVPPPQALVVMLEQMERQGAIGAFVDYPIGPGPETCNCAQVDRDGWVVWCGTGCLLLKAEAFGALSKPWFSCCNEVEVKVLPDGRVQTREFERPYDFGGQDIHFSLRLYRLKMPIAYVPPEVAICQHLELRTWGKKQENAGWHEIGPKPLPARWYRWPS